MNSPEMQMPSIGGQSQERPANVTPMTSFSPSASPAQENAALPTLESPMQVDAMLEKLQISFTIGVGDIVDGKITLQQGKSLVVRGRVRGEINCPGMVLIMKEGVVEGNIKAGHLWIEGEVRPIGETTSTVEAGALHIGTGALVVADCIYEKISIATTTRGIQGRLESRAAVEHGR